MKSLVFPMLLLGWAVLRNGEVLEKGLSSGDLLVVCEVVRLRRCCQTMGGGCFRRFSRRSCCFGEEAAGGSGEIGFA
ncbi:MAG: hypothetical protein QXS50_06480 [Candidatus Caldarchaeum sp.]